MIAPEVEVRGARLYVTAAPFLRTDDDGPLMFAGPAQARVGDTAVGMEQLGEHTVRVVIDRTGLAITLDRGCLSVVATPEPRPMALITRDEAAHVLNFFGGGGYPAGSFVRALLDALSKADPGNRGRLALAFPGYAEAVQLAKEHTGGMDHLARILRGAQ